MEISDLELGPKRCSASALVELTPTLNIACNTLAYDFARMGLPTQ